MPSSKNKHGHGGYPLDTSPTSGEFANRLHLATRMTLRWLQVLFSARPVGSFRWVGDYEGVENEEETELLTTLQSPDRVESPHNKPAISVVRTTASWLGTSRDGLMQPPSLDQEEIFADLAGLNIVFNCIAKEGIEAESLAWILFVSLRVPRLRAPLQKAAKLHAISNNVSTPPVTPMGALYPGSPVSSWRLCQVIVPVTFQSTVLIRPGEEPDFQVLFGDLTITQSTGS